MLGKSIFIAIACAGLASCSTVPYPRASLRAPQENSLVFAVPQGHRLHQSVTLGKIYGLPTSSIFSGFSEPNVREELYSVLVNSDMMAAEPAQAQYILDVQFSSVKARHFGKNAEVSSQAEYRIIDRKARTTIFSTIIRDKVKASTGADRYGPRMRDPRSQVAIDKTLRVRAPKQSIALFILAVGKSENIAMRKFLPCDGSINMNAKRDKILSEGFEPMYGRCSDNIQQVRTIY